MSDISTDRLQQALARAQAFFLESAENSVDARSFLQRRGINQATAAEYGLGFAPCDWQALVHAVSDKPAAVAAGLAAQAESRHIYSRFRERLMFPIHDAAGALIGFGGRSTADASPKYLNSPETDLFSKGEQLYGLSQAIKDSGLRSIGIAEGFMDVVASAQAGVRMVASMGTALTTAQVSLLFRHVDDLVLCMDGDAAGARAIDRALDVILPQLTSQRSVRICTLADGHDPDSYVGAYGGDRLATALHEAPNVARYLIERVARNHETAPRAYGELRDYIKKVPDAYVQSEFIDDIGVFYEYPGVAALAVDDGIDYLGDMPLRQGREAAPLGVMLELEQAHVLVARALFSCPDVARFVDVPFLDRSFGDTALGLVARAGDRVRAGEQVTGVDLLQEWDTQIETQPFVDYAMRGHVLSPALAREAINTAARVILEQTAPGFQEVVSSERQGMQDDK